MRSQLISTEAWIASLPSEQTERYTYGSAVYTGTDNTIEITCPDHGNFWQIAYIHKRKKAGCPRCYESRRGESSKSTKDEFIFKTSSVPAIAGKYDYSKVDYVNSITKVTVICTSHGPFEVTPANHLNGKGCRKCYDQRRYMNNLCTKEEFIEKSVAIQRDKYDYSRVVYLTCKDKVEIICTDHGSFWQTPDTHVQGAGCPTCYPNGYCSSKPGYAYILSDNLTTKVGITNRSPSHRAKEVFKSGGPKLDVIASFYFSEGQLARNLETACHKWLQQHYQPVDAIFDGSTECFLNVDIPTLLNFVSPLAQANTPELT